MIMDDDLRTVSYESCWLANSVSRVAESAALTDPAGLGAFAVVEWRVA